MAEKLCIDLCSGLGGFSEAFTRDSEWEVVRIDILKKFKPTIQADVRFIPLCENLQPDVLLASPPCQHFSLACPQFPRKGVKTALEIVGACFEAVATLKPKRWLIENPRGRLRLIIGKSAQCIYYSDYDKKFPRPKRTDLWGNIMLPMPKGIRRPRPGHIKTGWWRPTFGNDQAKSAEVPLGISEAVLEAVK